MDHYKAPKFDEEDSLPEFIEGINTELLSGEKTFDEAVELVKLAGGIFEGLPEDVDQPSEELFNDITTNILKINSYLRLNPDTYRYNDLHYGFVVRPPILQMKASDAGHIWCTVNVEIDNGHYSESVSITLATGSDGSIKMTGATIGTPEEVVTLR